MLYKYFNHICRYLRKRKTDIKSQNGFTIVEVLVSLLVITIIATVLVSGTRISVNTLKINKEKTRAQAIANEKIELIRALEYDDIPVNDPDDWPKPPSYDLPMLLETSYDIDYSVTEVDYGGGSYKQLEISVFKEPMNIPLKVITQIYPLAGSEGGFVDYPPPKNLSIEYDIGSGSLRDIRLIWEEPDTGLNITGYNIYRDGNLAGTTSSGEQLFFIDNPGYNYIYSYYVTAIYDGGIESIPSNTIATENEGDYAAPRDLIITGYEGSGVNRAVNLAWAEPDTETTVIQYIVYRDGVEVDRTGGTNYQNIIGSQSYDFHVTALYNVDIESRPSNTVTTEIEITYPPPRNLSITGYSGGGNSRKVNLAWDAPDTPLTVIQYVVYRGGVEIGRTTSRTYQNQIGKNNYTFYVTAVYEGGFESEEHSNEVTTS